MRRFLAVILLAMLPLQFSWAAVATYCAHESRGDGHFGHHEHRHHADAGSDAGLDAEADAAGDKAPGALDLDCGQCHGQCSVMPTLSATVPGALATEPSRAFTDKAGGAPVPTRPERPQWLRFA
jgi:hypothetical protein